LILSPQLILLGTIGIAALIVVAEVLHARRIRRASYLAFGRQGRRLWTNGAPVARVVASGLIAWGSLTLLALDGAPDDAHRAKPAEKHLLLVLDVSPSMYIADSGVAGKQSRQARAADLMQSVLDRLDLAHTRVSVVAFYSTARPVVVDSFDLNVITNILRDLPLSQAFKEGQTNMYEGIRAATALAKPWAPGSTTLVLVSDGDTLPEAGLPRLPLAIGDTVIIGVGNPYRATQVADRSSRQDVSSLKRLAARLQGTYHDGNAKHLPTDILGRLVMLGLDAQERTNLRTLALIAAGAGGAVLGLVAPLLAVWGRPRAVSIAHRIAESTDSNAHNPYPSLSVGSGNQEVSRSGALA